MIASIIIPTYNRLSLLKVTLDAISKIKEIPNKIECIVVDDGSKDETVKTIFSNYPWVKLIRQDQKGAPSARNLGLRKAKGSYIVFLDSDDLLAPDYFKNKLDILEHNPGIAGVYGSFEYFKGEGKYNHKSIVPRHTNYPVEPLPAFITHLQRLMGGWYLPCNAILWRRETVLSVGGQNERLRVNQDVDLMFRILINKNKIIGVQSGKALVRIHEGERIGVIGEDGEKLEQIYQLRKTMFKELERKNLASEEIRESLSRYCFDLWTSYRKYFPSTSAKFLKLSKSTFPKLKLRGRWYFVLLGILVGNEWAVKLKSLVK